MDQKKTFKVIILGEAGVGKTSLVRRYTQGLFSTRTTTTVGVDRVPVDINVDDDKLSFHLLDAAGCVGFRGLIKSYVSTVDAVIFMYDLTDKETFASLPLWNAIKGAGRRDITKVLVGNKKDLVQKRQVQFKNAKNYADFEGMINFEISVKEEESVDLVFQCVARELRLKRQLQESQRIKSTSKKSDFIEGKDSSPKQFVRRLSLMVMGKKSKRNTRRETPSTPAMPRRYEMTKYDSNRWDYYKWT